MTKIYTDNVVLRFADNEGVIKDISLNNLLEDGTPINTDDETKMEYLETYLLAGFEEQNQTNRTLDQ